MGKKHKKTRIKRTKKQKPKTTVILDDAPIGGPNVEVEDG